MEKFGDLETLVLGKIDGDSDFQTSIANLSDEEKTTAIQAKKSELIDGEIKSLNEKATEATKAKELADNYKKRAEKAETEFKKNNPQKEDKGLSQKDVLVLAKADIHEDDLDEVLDFAKYKNIPVAEALKNSTLKSILADKKEIRKSAEATNTRNARPGQQKVSDDALLGELSKGNVPEKGSSEAERIFWARRGGKR